MDKVKNAVPTTSALKTQVDCERQDKNSRSMHSQGKNSRSGHNYSACLIRFFFFKLRSTQLFFTYKALSLPRTKFNKNARVKPMMRQILSYLEPIVQLCSSISYKNRIEFSNNPTQFFILLSQNMHDHKNNNNNNNITSKTLIC